MLGVNAAPCVSWASSFRALVVSRSRYSLAQCFVLLQQLSRYYVPWAYVQSPESSVLEVLPKCACVPNLLEKQPAPDRAGRRHTLALTAWATSVLQGTGLGHPQAAEAQQEVLALHSISASSSMVGPQARDMQLLMMVSLTSAGTCSASCPSHRGLQHARLLTIWLAQVGQR